MAEIKYNKIDSFLKDLQSSTNRSADAGPAPQPFVYLVFGEELLYKTAYKKLLDILVPPASRSLNYEPVDGAGDSIFEVIERVNTFSLMSGRKVVALLDAGLFDAKKDAAPLLKKSRQAYDTDNLGSAATHLLRMMALLNLAFEDLTSAGLKKFISAAPALLDDDRWLADIVEYCRQSGRDAPRAADSESALLRAVEKGFPPGNCLIITTDTIDKRRKLYKTIRDTGVVIDCSVPKGNRKADKDQQGAVLNEITKALLAESGKTLAPGAFKALYEVTGFDLRTFRGNLQKLISYVGGREQITRHDIAAVLKRTQKDPIYAFTNAVTEKNVGDALFYMNSLMADATGSMRPEQILVAILNQVRKLLRVKEFTATDAGRAWFSGCPYGQFRSAVLPAVLEFDRELSQALEHWQARMTAEDQGRQESTPGRSKKKKAKVKTDLAVVKSANNPYPVYQMFLKSDRFSVEELLTAFEHLSRADLRIKTGSENKKLILEELVFNICRAT